MWLAAACSSHPQCAAAASELLIGDSTLARLEAILRVQAALLSGSSTRIPPRAAQRLRLSDRPVIEALEASVRLRPVLLRLESSSREALHGKLLLLDETVATEPGRGAKVILLAHEPAAAEGVLRGVDLLTSTGRRVKDVTRPEFLSDFEPHLGAIDVSHGGQDDAGHCGFLALHANPGVANTRAALEGALQLTDLQHDYRPQGGGVALQQLKALLGELPTSTARRSSMKMLVGCRAWPDMALLQQQLDLGMWKLVEVTEGHRELATAVIRTYKNEEAARAVWQALWVRST